MITNKELNYEYKNYVFIREELANCLGVDLDIDEIEKITKQANIISTLPIELKPFLSRTTISVDEAVNLISGNDLGFGGNKKNIINGFRLSILDAINNSVVMV